MKSYKLEDILPNLDSVSSYLTYRYIEDWCQSHIPTGRWRFDYSSTICAYGIDIPGRVVFSSNEDAMAFRMQYRVVSHAGALDFELIS